MKLQVSQRRTYLIESSTYKYFLFIKCTHCKNVYWLFIYKKIPIATIFIISTSGI